jgi:hypothetical protein
VIVGEDRPVQVVVREPPSQVGAQFLGQLS